MAGMGPAPKHESERRRRNPTPGHIQLPAEGRQGEPPAWPISAQSEAEESVWDQVWRTPQATQWEELGWVRTVARYVRVLILAETPKAPAPALAEARQLEDRLGLTPMAMLRLRWESSDPGPDLTVVRDPGKAGARRMRAVDPEAVARS